MTGKADRPRLRASGFANAFDLALHRPCKAHKAKVDEPCYEVPYAICGKRVLM